MRTYIAGRTPALCFAKQALTKAGIPVVDVPQWDVHHLLLDVPSFRDGGCLNLDMVLSSLPRQITIWGGGLNHPKLEEYRCIDLLQDEDYLLANAEITARCTIQTAQHHLPQPWDGLAVLIIGYGRIGKQLAPLLEEKGCRVTVAVRSMPPDPPRRHPVLQLQDAKAKLKEFQMIINTAPAPVLTREEMAQCKDCIKIDLASVKGIPGDDVVWARGLPGILAPEQSGRLIADTFLRRVKEETP